MNVLYEEEGGFRTGTIVEQDGGAMLVESAHKKRSRIKADKVLLQFTAPAVGELLAQAQAQSESIDVPFLWECVGSDEFGFADVAREYHGHAPSAVESRKDTSERSIAILNWPPSMASVRTFLSSGAVNRSISPRAAMT